MGNSQDRKSKMGAAITVRITINGKKHVISGIMNDGTLMVQLANTTKAEQANHELIVYLAKVLDIPTTTIEIVAGQKGMDKLVAITGLSPETVQEKLLINAGLTQAEFDRRRQNTSTNRQ
jgi:uncharacterized protein YggU (UPF0235/DUF167 family)